MKNEIVKDMNINDYHDHPGLSNSGLKLILDCPARYYTEYLDENNPKDEEKKKEFVLGSAVHSLVLEPEKFMQDNYVMPKCDRRTSKGKEEYEMHMHCAGRKNLMTVEQYEKADAMKHSILKRIKWLPDMLKKAHIEQSFFWVDEDTGVQLKSRPDAYTEDFYVDLKTVGSMKEFVKNVYRYNYHTQAAMAKEALHKLHGIKYSHFIYVIVEESYPYLAKPFCLDDASLDLGHKEFKRGAEIYKRCIESGEWSDYGSDVEQIYLPHWMA
ncbi:MAG: PD-(D/E)XK nuclease-like domain-containing protein [Patescibacteria group bacterium]|nr:PD-(D/E)XK nuclease-like domain-containing protein [Patescibacteria group bacterium]